MKIKITKDSFGPFRIVASREVDLKAKVDGVTEQDRYLSLGALYELERTPSGTAEKLFWTERDDKGKLVRGKTFRRNVDIPATDEAAEAIRKSLEASGYSDVAVEIREASDGGKPTKDDLVTASKIIEGGKQAKLGLDATATLQEVAMAYRQHRLVKEREAKAAAAAEFA